MTEPRTCPNCGSMFEGDGYNDPVVCQQASQRIHDLARLCAPDSGPHYCDPFEEETDE